MQLVVILSMLILTCGSYIVWPSRYNIPAHYSLGLFVVAYLIPCAFTDIFLSYPGAIAEDFTAIVALGAVCFLAGITLGYLTFPPISLLFYPILTADAFPIIASRVRRRAFLWMLVGLTLMITSFAVMGFVPAFTPNPLQAKFFRGEYRDSYGGIAAIYRVGWELVPLFIPILLSIWADTHRLVYFLFAAAGVSVLCASLTREPAMSGVLLFLGIYAARRGRITTFLYICLIPCIVALGAASYYILFECLGYVGSPIHLSMSSLAARLASGSPDLKDNLDFMSRFLVSRNYTYGRTLLGSLVPNHYKWNLSVWTLRIMSPNSDLNEIVSGGLRLPVPIWAFTCFGWIGVPIVSFGNGLLTGGFVRYTRQYVSRQTTYLHTCTVLLLFTHVYKFLYQPTYVSFYNIPAIVALCIVLGFWRTSRHRVRAGSSELESITNPT